MLRPGKGTIHGSKILDGFPDPYMLAVKLNRSREPELSQRKRQARDQFAVGLSDVILIDRGLTVHRESGSCLLPRGSAEQVEAKIVSHDAGQKPGFVISSVLVCSSFL